MKFRCHLFPFQKYSFQNFKKCKKLEHRKIMINRRIEVFGRIKPAVENSQIKDYTVEEGINDDVLKFSNEKYTSGRRSFRFKKIFRPETSTQEDVFENAAKPIIENVLTGYNGTIFAYGQTGTGKTYTMTGDFTVYKERGIIPRTIQFLFHCLKDTSTVTISYFEIYNEHGYDLIGFQPTTNTVELQQVNVLEDSRGNLHFRNLSAHNVRSVQEALDLLLFGDGNRMVAETMNNLRSSRSHTIFLVTLETIDPVNDSSIRSTLHLVDLAGSERLGKTGNMLNNSWESRYINLSLHYLEQVLVALGEPGRIHIPYRNSLMTTVLKNSLGGNCCTSMIATFSCEGKDFEETLQTCRFSQRVALVRNEAKINEITDINKELILLRRENAYLKDQLRELQAQQSSEENQDQELMEKDKHDCYERVKDFIADSHFMNLPLSDSKKAEYCFMLMRNEIMKLKPVKPALECQDDYKVVTGAISGHPSRTHRKFECNSLYDETPNQTNFRRKTDNVIRKRRVVMDIPKINVIYKKYKSTESISHEGLAREVPTESKVTSTESDQPGTHTFESIKHRSKVSHSAQTSTSLLKKQNRTHFSYESSGTIFSEDSEKLEDVLKEEIQKAKKELREKFSKTKTTTDSYDTIRAYEVKSLPYSSTDLAEAEEDFADNEEDDDDLQDIALPNALRNPQDSGRSSEFSTTDLPLTGDAEIDEEIVKFYRARYRKFKSDD